MVTANDRLQDPYSTTEYEHEFYVEGASLMCRRAEKSMKDDISATDFSKEKWKRPEKHDLFNFPISDVTNLGSSSVQPRNIVEPKRKKRATDAGVLLAIPPPIYYPDLKKSTITTKSSTARTPDPVRNWTSFVEKVESHEFDKTLKQGKKPDFRQYDDVDDISNEEDVRQALSVNMFENLNKVTVSRQPREKFKRISTEDNVKGEPDFIYKQRDKLLLAVEVKTFWVLNLKVCESLAEKYEDDIERKYSRTIPPNSGKEISVVDILRQVFGYLVVNNLQYGVLSTYNQSWFFRRPKYEPRALEISPTIDVRSRHPTLFQCYAFVQHLARVDTNSPSPGPTPPSSPSDDDSFESSDNNKDSGSDYEESLNSKQKRKRRSKVR
ncbi:5977_t:CDS:2 [Funneliformis caledonium]|uniref:5977_t:CDS:1 n=1 Tax=Funneliformis caledonium TaxID=1117310 RepID=A0A9N9DBN8_9GLOM|nr:5977_t:CDS:2 [Funneliformis caledonium]